MLRNLLFRMRVFVRGGEDALLEHHVKIFHHSTLPWSYFHESNRVMEKM